MGGLDLSRGRMRSRWRKLTRDPAAFADDLPWPVARTAAVAALVTVTRLASLLDRKAARLARAWARIGIAARDADGGWRLEGGAGEPPPGRPAMIEVGPASRPMVVCAVDDAGGVVAAASVGEHTPGILAVAGRPVRLHVYALDGKDAAPAEIPARPVTRAAKLGEGRRAGLSAAEALRHAWPAAERRGSEPTAAAYRAWIRRNEPGPDDLAALDATVKRDGAPLIVSVLMPVHDPRPEHLQAAIASVRAQAGGGWQLCIADDASQSPAVRQLLQRAAGDDRVHLVRLDASAGVAGATNAALALATGEACLFLDHDDHLAPQAVALVARAFAADPEVAAVYSDEDAIDAADRRLAPLFKPDFDRERLYAQNYVNHAFAVRTGLLRQLGGLSEGMDGAQDHDLVLRIADAGGAIRHIAHILYHWRVYPGGRSLSQGDAAGMQAARGEAVRRSLARAGEAGAPRPGAGGTIDRRPRLRRPAPSVTVIVPTRDRPGLLRACAAGVLRQTGYPDVELCIVDNGSADPLTLELLEQLAAQPRVKVIRVDAPFNFSALCNTAARDSASGLLLFLNDDVLVVEPGWLERMAGLAMRPRVGAVGAKLFYPDGRIQHAGLVLGLGPQGVAGHEFRAQAGDTPGPQRRLLVTRECSAVTAACMAVERRKFEAVGGFDEALTVAFNDVDLCLRLRQAGWPSVWTPHAQLIHMESASRGRDIGPERAHRFSREVALMHARWGDALRDDPCYNPNLTLADESFGLAEVSRAAAFSPRRGSGAGTPAAAETAAPPG